jgi:hypothetical protein
MSSKKFKITIVFCLLLLSFKTYAKEIKTNNIQLINSLNESQGEAFGYKNKKITINNFAELPITLNNSIGTNILTSATNAKGDGKSNQYALNSAEFFHRYRFFSNKFLSLTIQNSYKPLMIYHEDRNLALMPKQEDYEARLLIAHNMTDRMINNVLQNKNNYFLRYEIAYRRKFSNPFDEFKHKLWLGLKINEKFSLLSQYDLIFNVNAKANNHNNSYKNINNFQFSKHANSIINLGLIYRLQNDLALQFSVFKRLSGNNLFYDDKGLGLGLWQSF